MIKTNKGFTLIELLVVIAIIGILSSVVLASLNTARTKGSDAAVKSNLNGVRSQAELSYDSNGNSYANVCSDSTVTNAMNAARSAAGNTATHITAYGTAGAANTVTCHANSSSWGLEAPLKSGGFWCVDYTGISTSTAATSLAANDAVCG